VVVDLSLDECSRVEIAMAAQISTQALSTKAARSLRLSTNFKSNTRGGSLGIVDSFSTSLDVSTDTVVIAGMESVEVAESMEGDSVFRSIVTNSGRVPCKFAFCDIVSSLSTGEETITSKDGVSSDRGAL
jgi:hypothetical protein